MRMGLWEKVQSKTGNAGKSGIGAEQAKRRIKTGIVFKKPAVNFKLLQTISNMRINEQIRANCSPQTALFAPSKAQASLVAAMG